MNKLFDNCNHFNCSGCQIYNIKTIRGQINNEEVSVDYYYCMGSDNDGKRCKSKIKIEEMKEKFPKLYNIVNIYEYAKKS